MVATDGASPARETHLLRGVLEMAVLAILATEPAHAYAVVERLRVHGFAVGYGSIYPLVTRLRRLHLVQQEPQPSTAGPPRNVLRLTATGHEALAQWRLAWTALDRATNEVLAGLEQPTDAR